MSTAAVKRYWTKLAELGCVVDGCGAVPQIAHVIGKPSVTERVKEPKPKGKKLPRHDWLVIPCCHHHHSVSPAALDLNPAAFEKCFGPVASHIDRIAKKLGVDVWAKSQEGRKV